MNLKPLAIDLYSGLGGWANGLLEVGWKVIGFDIEAHCYDGERYPGQLVIQDVLTLHGSQFKAASLIVASPPCQGYSYRAMPWKRAKSLPPPDNTLFDACFRIQREACAAAGRQIPMIVENVRGAQKWVGTAKGNYGSFYLWGDVPALLPLPWKHRLNDGVKGFTPNGEPLGENQLGKLGWSNSKVRKAASARIAKIPQALALWIAKVFWPETLDKKPVSDSKSATYACHAIR